MLPDTGAVLHDLRGAFGVSGEALAPLAGGFTASTVVVLAAGEPTHVAKIWPEGAEPPAHVEATTRLVATLGRHLDSADVAAPVPTVSGRWVGRLGGRPATVSRFVPGGAAPDTARTWSLSGRILAELHALDPATVPALPHGDGGRGVATWARGLMTHVGPGDARWAGVASRADEVHRILDRLDRLDGLVERVADDGGPRVVCHTDFGGENLVQHEGGRPVVLDWDEALVSYPEHDLWIATRTDAREFLRTYTEAGGVSELSATRFELACLARYVGDFAARLELLLHGADGAAVPELRRGIEEWGFSRWAGLDARMTTIREALSPAG